MEDLLAICADAGIAMTFAITGLSAVEGGSVLQMREQIRKIADLGHEIASHSWKHEWFPFLTRRQIRMSLQRSKEALEDAAKKEVLGFVLPFTRPMTWIGRGNFSFGDRGIWPLFFGGDQGNIYKVCRELGYDWVRVKERPIYEKFTRQIRLHQPFDYRGIHCLPNHYNGFDDDAIQLIQSMIGQDCVITINAHPLMLSKEGNKESWHNFRNFIKKCLQFRSEGHLEFSTPSLSTAI